MKNALSILLIFLCIFAGCKKSGSVYTDEGVLTGPDIKMNICSGGVYLQTKTKLYHVEGLPGMSQEDFYNLHFPVIIKFTGQKTEMCPFYDDGYFKINAYSF